MRLRECMQTNDSRLKAWILFNLFLILSLRLISSNPSSSFRLWMRIQVQSSGCACLCIKESSTEVTEYSECSWAQTLWIRAGSILECTCMLLMQACSPQVHLNMFSLFMHADNVHCLLHPRESLHSFGFHGLEWRSTRSFKWNAGKFQVN